MFVIIALFLVQNLKIKVLTAQENLLLECLLTSPEYIYKHVEV